MASTPCIRLVADPTAAPQASPTHALPTSVVAQNPVTAPISIMPSTPKFMMPLRWVSISPVPASTSGVPATIATAMD